MCGIFGFLLLDERQLKHVYTLLQRMMWVTMVRGAQSGGVVTYTQRGKDVRAVRTRVLNGKRTDLSQLVPKAVARNLRRAKLCFPHMYQGHTRFATSSVANFEGTHPHCWSLPTVESVWSLGEKPQCRKATVELYICHNGDFDCFKFGKHTAELGDVQEWLVRATGCKAPCKVDSAAIAGVLDIVRAQGCWYRAVRFGFHLGIERAVLKYDTPESELRAASKALEDAFAEGRSREDLAQLGSTLKIKGIKQEDRWKWAKATVDAFFDNDLQLSVEFFMARAIGSFGLCVTASDAHHQVCLAARGQPLSVAFYEDCGAVLFASELNAVKAGMSVLDYSNNAKRVELDHIGGEICFIDTSLKETFTRSLNGGDKHAGNDGSVWLRQGQYASLDGSIWFTQAVLGGAAQLTLVRKHPEPPRWTQLYNNKNVVPLPSPEDDPVGTDIKDIPEIVNDLIQDWHTGYGSSNRVTALTWGRALLNHLQNEDIQEDHVNVLVVGCEVSLWAGEQFAADLKLLLPRLDVQAVSSNKILGLLGQDHALYSSGFQLSEEAGGWVLKDTIILLISHSGCTFSSLLCTTLLRCFSSNTFILTSEADTLMANEVKGVDETSRHVFSTNVGFRPAEPVSVSFVGTHVLLSLLLEYTMLVFLRADQHNKHVMKKAGASFTNDDLYMYIEHMNRLPDAIHGIVKEKTRSRLRAEGRQLANHVLESPRVWIIVAIYILVTVTFGVPIVSTSVNLALCQDRVCEDELPATWTYVVGALDAMVYIFCAQLAHLALRKLQGRPLLHRMTGRSVVIADTPMVGQVVRAFASKCFACTYSNTEVNFHNGCATDHLLHRFTHQIRRGSLLVVGRPDGRLADLTVAEAAVCLSVTQACSIQNHGVTAEAITVGHNPWELGCAKSNIILPTTRPDYLSDELISGTHNSPAVIIAQMKNASLDVSEQIMGQIEALKLDIPTSQVSIASINGEISTCSLEWTKQSLRQDLPDTPELGNQILDVFERSFKEARKLCSSPMFCSSDLLTPQSTVGTPGLHNYFSSAFDAGEQLGKEIVYEPDAECPTRYMRTFGFARVLDRTISVNTAFGNNLKHKFPNRRKRQLLVKQRFMVRLYEARFASLERTVAFFILFHAMARRVQRFWGFFWWLGLGYRLDRSQSNCRVMTTASPVSGMDVLTSMEVLRQIRQHRTAFAKIKMGLSESIRYWRFRKRYRQESGSTDVPDVREPVEALEQAIVESSDADDLRLLSERVLELQRKIDIRMKVLNSPGETTL